MKKGKISIKDFIKDVKNELLLSVDDVNPFFTLEEVELEVAFVLDAKAKASAKFLVVDIEGEAKATQTHRVKLKLTPFIEEKLTSEEKSQNYIAKRTKPKYKKKREI